MVTPSVTPYHPLARALHWALALLIVGNFALGVYMHELPFSPARLQYYSWHKWAGVLVLAFSAVRLLTRVLKSPPELPPVIESAMPGWQKLAHHATHIGLYALFFAVPLSGWAFSSAAGFPVVLFGVLPLPDFVPVSEGLADALAERDQPVIGTEGEQHDDDDDAENDPAGRHERKLLWDEKVRKLHESPGARQPAAM